MKNEINAVHDDQLEEVLNKLEVLGKIKSGLIKCKFTNEVITLENIHCFFPESGDIKFVSNSPEAIKKFSVYINENDL